MVEVLLVHLVLEYMLQPEPVIAMKRAPHLKGVAVLFLHVLIPVLVCLPFGLLSLWQALLIAVLHAILDGPLGVRLVVLTRIQSVHRALSSSYEDWPMQVQALEFALCASSERQWYLVAHLFAVYVGMSAGALL